jgi:hypothetical protein
MIPQIIHYVWVGGAPLPAKYEVNIASWRETNPGFAIRAWTNETVEAEHPYLQRALALGNWANASNYLRLATVIEHGGVYLDTDVMLVGSLSPYLRNGCFLGFQSERREKDWVNNAVFGAVPGHPFIRACLDRLTAEFDGSEPANHSAPRLVTRLLVEMGLADYAPGGVALGDVVIYPPDVFYPYGWNEPFTLDAVTDHTVAVHFWDKTWHRPSDGSAACGGADDLQRRADDAEVALQMLVRDAVAARRKRAPWRRWLARLAFCFVLAAPSATVAALPDCGQRFVDDANAPNPSDPATTELSCSREPASRRHCIAVSGDALDRFDVPTLPSVRAYALWLRVATDSRSTTVRLSLNEGVETAWFIPPTPAHGWQRATEASLLAPGMNNLRVTPSNDPRVAVDCALFAADPEFVPDMRAVHRIDRAWSGVGVLFDAVADRKRLYVGYYDANRALAVAAFDRYSRTWQRHRLGSVFEGWDNHNAIALAIDRAGALHIAGNMHASPLVYGRTAADGDIATLALLNRMTGAGEWRASYPTWTTDADGALVFLYRDGVSGAGRIFANRYADGAWRRLASSPLFADRDANGSVSAYPTAVTEGSDGYRHIAWVWRSTADAATSFEVGYARTLDFVHWQDRASRTLALPIRPGQAAVDPAAERSGLTTQVELGFDAASRPVVSYLRYDREGHTQLYNARPDGDGWRIVQATDWTDRWEIAGHGTLAALIRHGPVRAAADGTLRQTVRHWRAGASELVLDAANLRPIGTAPVASLLPRALSRPTLPPPGFNALVIAARMTDRAAKPFVVRWEAQPSDRDRRPECTAERPVACDPPPSHLIVYEPML